MKIKQQAPPMYKAESIIADKIANIVLPESAVSIWDEFKKQRVGSPAQVKTAGSTLLKTSTPPITSSLMGLGSSLLTTNRYLNGLPNLAAPPAQGIATARQQREVAGGSASSGATAKGDTQYVDDKGYPVTLQQILGSRMLTSAQMQAASIQNVSKLFNVVGGTSKEQMEVRYMFQRMMLEGFIRGIDITKDIKKQGGITFRFEEMSGNTMGSSSQGTVRFDQSIWRDKNEASKLALFYHEVGHDLLNKQHIGVGNNTPEENWNVMTQQVNHITAQKFEGTYDKFGKNDVDIYNKMMNRLFTDEATANYGGIAHMRIPVNTNVDATFDPSWYPQLAEGQPGYDPGGSGGGGTTVDNTVNVSTSSNTTLNQTTYNPVNVEYSGAAPTVSLNNPRTTTPTTGAGGTAGQPSNPINASTKSFAAGMADLSQPNQMETDPGLLLKSG